MIMTNNILNKGQNQQNQQGKSLIFRISKMKPQCFDISPCRKIICIGYTNKCLIFWDFISGQKLKCHQLSFIPIQIFYSADGKYQLIRSKQNPKKIYIYQLNSMEQEEIIQSTYLCQKILQFNISQNQEALILGLSHFSIINYKNKGIQQQINCQFVSLTTLKNKDQICSVNCHDEIAEINIILFKTNFKIIKKTFFKVQNGNINIQTSKNNSFIVSSNKSKNRIWNVQTMKLLRKKYYGEDHIGELLINSISNLVYFHLSSFGIVVWNISTGRHRVVIEDQKNRLSCLQVISNCQLIYKSNWHVHSTICF
ncbi:unnamed protein product [Paramecium sonneborni]|uniref:Uncharacterized protein n=1 Tax=Paramecium sonneborni TaxID=65129 RepID=A0A8S1QFI7_9CILI|nr:unnamed protein product [Paramecium sonneborni]